MSNNYMKPIFSSDSKHCISEQPALSMKLTDEDQRTLDYSYKLNQHMKNIQEYLRRNQEFYESEFENLRKYTGKLVEQLDYTSVEPSHNDLQYYQMYLKEKESHGFTRKELRAKEKEFALEKSRMGQTIDQKEKNLVEEKKKTEGLHKKIEQLEIKVSVLTNLSSKQELNSEKISVQDFNDQIQKLKRDHQTEIETCHKKHQRQIKDIQHYSKLAFSSCLKDFEEFLIKTTQTTNERAKELYNKIEDFIDKGYFNLSVEKITSLKRDLKAFKMSMGNYSSLFNDSQLTIEDLSREKEELLEKNCSLAEVLESVKQGKEDSIVDFSSKLCETISELQETKDINENLILKYESLNEQNKEQASHIDSLYQTNNKLYAEISKLKELNSILNKKLSGSNKNNKEGETSTYAEVLEIENEQLKNIAESAKLDLFRSKNEIKKLKTEILEIKEKHNKESANHYYNLELIKDTEKLKELFLENFEKIEYLEEKLKTTYQELAARENLIDCLRVECANTHAQLIQTNQRSYYFKEQYVKYFRDLETLQGILEPNREDSSESIEDLSTLISNLQAEESKIPRNSNTNPETKTLNQQIKSLDEKNKSLELEISELAKEIEYYKSQLALKQEELERSQTEYKDNMKSLDSQVAFLTLTNQEQNQEISNLIKKSFSAEKLSKEVKIKDERIYKLELDLGELKSKLFFEVEHRDELIEQLMHKLSERS